MKNLVIILVLLVSGLGYTQTELDKLVFDKVNQYRVSKGINKLVWCDKAFNASKQHSTYLKNNEEISHDENSDTPTVLSRLKKQNITNIVSYGENCAQIINATDGEYSSNDILSTLIVDLWKKSPPHNKIMLSGNFTYAGVSCIKHDMIFVYATIDFYQKLR
jgi:uncharacterized protein YkwD